MLMLGFVMLCIYITNSFCNFMIIHYRTVYCCSVCIHSGSIYSVYSHGVVLYHIMSFLPNGAYISMSAIVTYICNVPMKY